MPDFDYGPEDIDHIDVTYSLFHEPYAHVDMVYLVTLKNGETREHREGTLTGIPAAEVAIGILQSKHDLDAPPAPAEPHAWRHRG